MRVAIVTMPFAALRPAMGASLLVAQLRRTGTEATVIYLNMLMHRRLGGDVYDYVADRAPTQSLAGDWVFAESLFGVSEERDARYVQLFRSRFPTTGGSHGLQLLQKARADASSYLDECVSSVDWGSWDVVGFTSSFTQHVASLALAERIKAAHPAVTIVFGGANCEDRMGVALHRSFPVVDFVCSGEAEVSFPTLIARLAAKADPSGIPGVVSRRDGATQVTSLRPDRVAHLDDLPYPDFDDYVAGRRTYLPSLADQPVGLLMETSRGCWWGEKHHCTFCGLNGTSMTYRSKSADRVVAELTTLTARYGARHVEMVDNILDMRHLREVLPRVADLGLGVELFYEVKANLTKEQLRVLRAAGVTSIQPGIESFSTNVLRIMRKGTTAAQNIQLLKWCAEIGIAAYWNLLYGFPGETAQDYEEMTVLMDALTHLEPPTGLGRVRLDRFSPNYDQGEQLGFDNIRPDRSYAAIYDLPEAELTDLAYYFEYDGASASPLRYDVEADRAVQRWKRTHTSRSLVCVDHGDTLAIWDSRPVAARLLTILDGWQRSVYLHCDEHRSRHNVEQLALSLGVAAPALDELLQDLLARRLMVLVDDRLLSLAVQVPPTRATSAAEPTLVC